MDEELDRERKAERKGGRREKKSEKELTSELERSTKVYTESNLETKQLCASLLAQKHGRLLGTTKHRVEKPCEKRKISRHCSAIEWQGMVNLPMGRKVQVMEMSHQQE